MGYNNNMGNLQQNDKKAVLTTLAAKEPKLKEGINAILNDQLVFDSLDRAVTNLVNAKNDANLNSVEAALESTITRVRELNESKKEYMDDKKASLYLYTLRNLTSCLGDWQFENGTKNEYVPQITKKFTKVMVMAGQIGADTKVIEQKCSAHQYKVASDPYLADFELLDHAKMDTLLQGMQRYQDFRTSDIMEDLNTPEKPIVNGEIDHGMVELHEVKEKDLDRLIADMTQRFGEEKMALGYIKGHLNEFYNMVGMCTNHSDLESIQKFTTEIVKRLWERQKEQDQQNQMAPKTQTVGVAQ